MKHASSAPKTVRSTAHIANPDASAGLNGIAIALPAYGMDVVDRQPVQAALEHGPGYQPLASATWPARDGAIQRRTETANRGSSASEGHQENKTGLPDHLKASVETLSGLAMDNVRVHYNSARPAQLQALAYTQGAEIHVGPGQERHLPHEAWHVVQQKQGRVKPTIQVGGVSINDDKGLEREADVMGTQAIPMKVNLERDHYSAFEHFGPRITASKDADTSTTLPLQMVKQPPVGNFARYVASNLTNSAVTAGVHPNDAEVAAEGHFGGASVPANSYGWAALLPNAYTLTGATGVNNTQINIDPRVDHHGNHLYRMHLIHHSFAANANHNINNIVLGPHAFNTFHLNHVENFMGDSINANFWNSSGGNSLTAMLVVGDVTGQSGAGPYVVGAPPTFPAGLLTGAVIPAMGGVPPNAQQITTDEQVLDRFVTLWYFVRPIFGLNAAILYASLVAHLNNEYNNRPAGATNWGEIIPAGILGAGGMLQNMADALAGIYATALEVQGSFFTPEPEEIPLAGSTANLLPWRDNRIPRRTLNNNAGNPYVWIQLSYDGGMGIIVNTPAAILQL